MLELEEAVTRILALVPPARPEQLPLDQAHGRVLFNPVISTADLPPFDNSAMDGYAARAEDTAGASAANPARLQLAGRVVAGESFCGAVASGSCVRIFTGSPLPAGTDCVVMQEDTRIEPARPEEIRVLEPARPWENVRLRGEDIHCGSAVLDAGQELTAGRLSLLAALGTGKVSVGCQPIVGLIATGSELQEPGQPLRKGQIYESNRTGLSALIHAAGGQPVVFPIVSDSLQSIAAALSEAQSRCDMIVTIGGASVGELDLVKPALERAGAILEFWKVAIKPGRPFVFGQAKGKLIFGLPGNPVSALVTFLLLVRPALRRYQGASETGLPYRTGVLLEPLANPGERRHFMRVCVNHRGDVSAAGPQASHMLSSFAGATGLVDVPARKTLPKGAVVRVMVWEL